MGPDIAVLDHKNPIDRFTFTIDSKDIHFMPDEKDDKATDEESDYKKAMDAKFAALDAKVSAFMASGADESDDDDDKAEDMGDHDKGEDADEDDDKAEDGEEDRDVTGSDEDEDDKDAGMDAAVEVKSLRRELKAHQRNGTRQVMREIRKRDALYDKVSPHIGAFDHADMDSQAMAVYGCKKLGIEAQKGHEISALDGYLTGRQRPTAAPAFGADSANKSAEPSPIAAHFKKS
jgi:hypothetical protein